MAFVVIPSGWLSAVWPVIALLTVVPIGLLIAPSASRDKRMVVFFALLVGAAAVEAVTKICDWCPYCLECWFL